MILLKIVSMIFGIMILAQTINEYQSQNYILTLVGVVVGTIWISLSILSEARE